MQHVSASYVRPPVADNLYSGRSVHPSSNPPCIRRRPFQHDDQWGITQREMPSSSPIISTNKSTRKCLRLEMAASWQDGIQSCFISLRTRMYYDSLARVTRRRGVLC
jgi:hypothetical protein